MDVVLVGLELPDVENHSLAALARAVERDGRRAAIVGFGGWPDLDRAVSAVLAERPRICGVSIQTTEMALACLAFTRILRGRGFEGRIVCGGHFATLNAEDILRAPTGVDAVVRFAGEEALVGLARGEGDPERLPGLVYRTEDGVIRTGAPPHVPPAPPLRASLGDDPLPVHLGFSAADLVLSHGCEARCAYCCIAGASELARREVERAGGDGTTAIYGRVPATAIADEIAWLWHEKHARVFNFMDDNLLPLDPDGALGLLEEIGAALRRRRVGRIAFSLQMRADVVTPAVADALVELGLVRAYVGIDGYSAPQLRALGRHAVAQAGPDALETLNARGVFSLCNALLLGPTVPFDSIRAEIDGLERVRHAPVHLLPIDVRAGTTYFRRAEQLGLMEGSFLFRRYRFVDERTELVAGVVAGLPSRIAEHSVPIALYDLGYNLGIARRLVPEADVSQAVSSYARVAAQWNADQVRLLRAAVEVAATRDRALALALLARERPFVRAHDDALRAECERALVAVERAVSMARGARVRAHARGRLLSAVAFSMGLAACGTTSGRGDGD